jgi:hypothetical protein
MSPGYTGWNLYHTMILLLLECKCPCLLDAIRTKPLKRFEFAVHKLVVADPPSDFSAEIQAILYAFRGTTDLFLAPKRRVLLPIVSTVPLQRLPALPHSLLAGHQWISSVLSSPIATLTTLFQFAFTIPVIRYQHTLAARAISSGQCV